MFLDLATHRGRGQAQVGIHHGAGLQGAPRYAHAQALNQSPMPSSASSFCSLM